MHFSGSWMGKLFLSLGDVVSLFRTVLPDFSLVARFGLNGAKTCKVVMLHFGITKLKLDISMLLQFGVSVVVE